MAKANLGHKNLLNRVPFRERQRRCPVCGEIKLLGDFKVKKRSRVLDMVCAGCRRDNPEAVREFYRPERSVLEIHKGAIISFLTALAERRISRGKEAKGMGDEMGHTPSEYAARVAKLPDRIAAIISKTYAEMGEAFTLSDDEANMMIRDLLNELDETLIPRNKKKRLSRG